MCEYINGKLLTLAYNHSFNLPVRKAANKQHSNTYETFRQFPKFFYVYNKSFIQRKYLEYIDLLVQFERCYWLRRNVSTTCDERKEPLPADTETSYMIKPFRHSGVLRFALFHCITVLR